MGQIGHQRWFRLAILLALVACTGAWGFGMARSYRDRTEVAKMTENMKTVCVGRYLIDVPAQADTSQSHETVAGFAIQTIEESDAVFHNEMLRVTKVRTGKRDINDMHGEEALERVRELNLATTYGFMWETQGVKDDPTHPFLSLELQAGLNPEPGGKPTNASLHQDAMLTLWDAISSSIRRRPNVFPSTAVPARHP